jgi:hypothetical protein
MLTLKQTVFEAVDALPYPVFDYPKDVTSYPYILMRTSNDIGTTYKESATQEDVYFTFDIFSNYKGEKQIYDIESAIYGYMQALYDEDARILYVKKEQFRILDDVNPLLKHGVLIYRITMMEV